MEKVHIDRSKYYSGELSAVAADADNRRRRRQLEEQQCNQTASRTPFASESPTGTAGDDDISHLAGQGNTLVTATVSHDGLRATILVGGDIYRVEPFDKTQHAKSARAARDGGHNHVIYAHSHTGNIQGQSPSIVTS